MTAAGDEHRSHALALLGNGRIGLALGSGAARGWAHIGVIRALAEAGIVPDVVCGTSMGAVVGAAYAAGKLADFERWARDLEWRRVVSYLDVSLRGGLIKARRLFEFFDDQLADVRIESLDPAFAAVATDLANGQEVWLREGLLVDALRATVALPGLITPARWHGRWLVDGGLVNPVPVSLCRALGADRVIAVDLNTTLLGRRFGGERSALPARKPEPPPEPEPPHTSGHRPDASVGERINAALRELAGDMRDRFSSNDAVSGDELPTLYDVMANSVNIMQVRIARSRMAGDPPELLVTPRMQDFGILDFDRADEAIDEGARALGRALVAAGTQV